METVNRNLNGAEIAAVFSLLALLQHPEQRSVSD